MTTTLVVVLFTTIVLGGGTMPLMKYLESRTGPGRYRGFQKKRRRFSKLKNIPEVISNDSHGKIEKY